MCGVRALECLPTSHQDFFGVAVVDRLRRHEPQTGVPVLGVVVREEGVTERASMLDPTEAIRERRAVLEGLELRLGVRNMCCDTTTFLKSCNQMSHLVLRYARFLSEASYLD